VDGQALPHYSPSPMPLAAGVNIFAQRWGPYENPYVFPPFSLIGSVLKHVIDVGVECTFVAPAISPYPCWWPTLQKYVLAQIVVGRKGEKGLLFFPSKKGYVRDRRGLQWTLIAYRLGF